MKEIQLGLDKGLTLNRKKIQGIKNLVFFMKNAKSIYSFEKNLFEEIEI